MKLKPLLLIFVFFILIVNARATTINNTDIYASGINTHINITRQWTFTKIITDTNFIYVQNLTSSNDNEASNEGITFNLTETNQNYKGTDMPYFSFKDTYNRKITSAVTQTLPSEIYLNISNCSQIEYIKYNSLMYTSGWTCSGNTLTFPINITYGTTELSFSYNPSSMTNPIFNRSILYFNYPVTVSSIYSDPEHANGNVYFKCYRNSLNFLNRTYNNVADNTNLSFSIAPGNFSKGDLINCSVYSDDGYANSTTYWSNLEKVPYIWFNSTTSLWNVNIIAPDLTGDQDLFIKLNHTTDSTYSNCTQSNAITYGILSIKPITSALSLGSTLQSLSHFFRSGRISIFFNIFTSNLFSFFKSLIIKLSIQDRAPTLSTSIRLITQATSIHSYTLRLYSHFEDILQQLSLIDTVSRFYLSIQTPNLVLQLTDSISILRDLTQSFTESLTLIDNMSRLQSALRVSTQPLNLYDIIDRITYINRGLNQPLAFQISISSIYYSFRDSTQPVQLTDIINVLRDLTKSFTEPIRITDSINILRDLTKTFNEVTTLIDSVSNTQSILRLSTQPTNLHDIIIRITSIFRAKQLTLTFNNSISRLYYSFRDFNQPIQITNPIGVLRDLTQSFTERLALTYRVSSLQSIFRTATQSLNIVDTANRVSYVLRISTDNAIINLSAIRLYSSLRQLNQPTHITDSISFLRVLTKTFTEPFALNHSISSLQSIFRSISHPFTIIGTINRMTNIKRGLNQHILAQISLSHLYSSFRGSTESIQIVHSTHFFRDLTKSFIESLPLIDSMSLFQSISRQNTQPLQLIDSISVLQSLARTFIEPFTLTGLSDTTLSISRFITQPVQSIDKVSYLREVLLDLAQPLNVIDSIGRLTSVSRTLSLPVTLIDTISGTWLGGGTGGYYVRSASNLITVFESGISTQSMFRVLTQPLHLVDLINRISYINKLANQPLLFGAITSRSFSSFVDIYSHLRLIDSTGVLNHFINTFNQPFSVIPTISIRDSLSRYIAEQIQATDSMINLISISHLISEQLFFITSSTNMYHSYHSITNQINLIDSAGLMRDLIKAFNINLNINDLTQTNLMLYRQFSNNITTVQVFTTVSRGKGYSFSNVEQISVVDSVNRISNSVKALFEVLNISTVLDGSWWRQYGFGESPSNGSITSGGGGTGAGHGGYTTCFDHCVGDVFYYNATLDKGLCLYHTETCQYTCGLNGCVCKEDGDYAVSVDECCSGNLINQKCAQHTSISMQLETAKFKVYAEPMQALIRNYTISNPTTKDVYIEFKSDSNRTWPLVNKVYIPATSIAKFPIYFIGATQKYYGKYTLYFTAGNEKTKKQISYIYIPAKQIGEHPPYSTFWWFSIPLAIIILILGGWFVMKKRKKGKTNKLGLIVPILFFFLIIPFTSATYSVKYSLNSSHVLNDVSVDSNNPTTNYGTDNLHYLENATGRHMLTYIQFNLSRLYDYSSVANATLSLYVRGNNLDGDEGYGIEIALVNESYNESTMTYNTRADYNWSTTFTHASDQSITGNNGTGFYLNFNVTEQLQWAHNQGYTNLSMVLIRFSTLCGTTCPDNYDDIYFYSKEGTSNQPRLNYTLTNPTTIAIKHPTNNSLLKISEAPDYFYFNVTGGSSCWYSLDGGQTNLSFPSHTTYTTSNRSAVFVEDDTGYDPIPPNNAVPPYSSTEISDNEYGYLEAVDSVYYHFAVPKNAEGYATFNFTTNETDETQLNYTWVGKAQESNKIHITFWAWNFSSSSWANCSKTVVLSTAGQTRNCVVSASDFVSSTHTSYFLVHGSDWDNSNTQQYDVYSDYVGLTVPGTSRSCSNTNVSVTPYTSKGTYTWTAYANDTYGTMFSNYTTFSLYGVYNFSSNEPLTLNIILKRTTSIFKQIQAYFSVGASVSPLSFFSRINHNIINLRDSITNRYALIRALPQQLQFIDSINVLRDLTFHITNELRLYHSVSVFQDILKDVSQSAFINNLINRFYFSFRDVFQSSRILDSLDITRHLTFNSAQHLQFNNFIFAIQSISRVPIQQLNFYDSAASLSSVTRSVTNKFALTDSTNRLSALSIGLSQPLPLSDLSDITLYLLLYPIQHLHFDDSISPIQSILRDSTQLSSLTELTNRFYTSFRNPPQSILPIDLTEIKRYLTFSPIQHIQLKNIISAIQSISRVSIQQLKFYDSASPLYRLVLSFNDKLILTGSINRFYNSFRSILESISLSDLSGITRYLTFQFNQHLTFFHSAPTLRNIFRDSVQSLEIIDSINPTYAFNRIVSQSAIFFDLSGITRYLSFGFDQPLNLSDFTSTIQYILRSVFQPFPLTETTNRFYLSIRSISQLFRLSESSDITRYLTFQSNQQLQFSDIASVIQYISRDSINQLNFYGSVRPIHLVIRSIINKLSLMDSENRFYNSFRAISISTQISDSFGITRYLTFQVSQHLKLSQLVSSLKSAFRYQTQSTYIIDNVNRMYNSIRSINQPLQLTQSINILRNFIIHIIQQLQLVFSVNPIHYALTITQPLSTSPTYVEGGDILQLNFNFTKNSIPITSGITINNITISNQLCQLIGASWCYQESANVSTSCGGLGTGNYNLGGDFVDPPLLIDGDWQTKSNTSANTDIFFNYSIPANINGAKWQVKNGYYFFNLSLPGACLSGNILQLKYHLAADAPARYRSVNAYCFNYSNNAWAVLSIYGEGTEANDFYEEAVEWNFSTPNYNSITHIWSTSCNVPSGLNDLQDLTLNINYSSLHFIDTSSQSVRYKVLYSQNTTTFLSLMDSIMQFSSFQREPLNQFTIFFNLLKSQGLIRSQTQKVEIRDLSTEMAEVSRLLALQLNIFDSIGKSIQRTLTQPFGFVYSVNRKMLLWSKQTISIFDISKRKLSIFRHMNDIFSLSGSLIRTSSFNIIQYIPLSYHTIRMAFDYRNVYQSTSLFDISNLIKYQSKEIAQYFAVGLKVSQIQTINRELIQTFTYNSVVYRYIFVIKRIIQQFGYTGKISYILGWDRTFIDIAHAYDFISSTQEHSASISSRLSIQDNTVELRHLLVGLKSLLLSYSDSMTGAWLQFTPFGPYPITTIRVGGSTGSSSPYCTDYCSARIFYTNGTRIGAKCDYSKVICPNTCGIGGCTCKEDGRHAGTVDECCSLRTKAGLCIANNSLNVVPELQYITVNTDPGQQVIVNFKIHNPHNYDIFVTISDDSEKVKSAVDSHSILAGQSVVFPLVFDGSATNYEGKINIYLAHGSDRTRQDVDYSYLCEKEIKQPIKVVVSMWILFLFIFLFIILVSVMVFLYLRYRRGDIKFL